MMAMIHAPIWMQDLVTFLFSVRLCTAGLYCIDPARAPPVQGQHVPARVSAGRRGLGGWPGRVRRAWLASARGCGDRRSGGRPLASERAGAPVLVLGLCSPCIGRKDRKAVGAALTYQQWSRIISGNTRYLGSKPPRRRSLRISCALLSNALTRITG